MTDTTYLAEEQTWQWPPGHSSTTSPNIVTIKTGFAGSVAFVVSERVSDHGGAVSATAAINPAGPTLGTVSVTGDGQTVLVPMTNVLVSGDYTLTITVTTSDSQTIPLSGNLTVE